MHIFSYTYIHVFSHLLLFVRIFILALTPLIPLLHFLGPILTDLSPTLQVDRHKCVKERICIHTQASQHTNAHTHTHTHTHARTHTDTRIYT